MAVEVHGLDALEGETAFAFFVLRLRAPLDRAGVIELMRFVAPLIPDVDTFIDELPDDLEQGVRILAMPWAPAEAGHATLAQRRLLAAADARGVEAAWFFQTGTSLPSEDDDDDDELDDDDDDEDVSIEEPAEDRATTAPERMRATTMDDTLRAGARAWSSGEIGGDTKPTPIEIVDLSSDEDFGGATNEDIEVPTATGEALDDDTSHTTLDEHSAADDGPWSHGVPPQVETPRFPVDRYPAILDELDWEDFGIAVKLRGDALPGEATVLLGFHTLWLAPYGGRYRNAAVTFDRKHHAAHLWVDRFAVPCSAAEQVRHLLWIVSKLDEVVPVVHARFEGATMAQKYGGLMGDAGEPFVLAGNPLFAIYAQGGEAAVDRWIGEQTDWSNDEVAQMLRELAVEIVTTAPPDDERGEEVDAVFDDEPDGEDDDDDDGDQDDDDDEGGDEDDDDDEAEGNEDEDRGRQITTLAGALLVARAHSGKLDPRIADKLLPVLADEQLDARQTAVVQIMGALRHQPAVPALIQILERATDKHVEDLTSSAAAALGAIGDPAAIPALAKALGSGDAEVSFAYGRLVHHLPPDRRVEARRRISDTVVAADDPTAILAREAALVLASPVEPELAAADPQIKDLRELLHDSLTLLDSDRTVRNVRLALRVAEALPDLVDADDLVWLTRFAEADVRDRAHALLDKLGKPLQRAPIFDRVSARALADDELVRRIAEPHVIGRAALIDEASRRGVSFSRPHHDEDDQDMN